MRKLAVVRVMSVLLKSRTECASAGSFLATVPWHGQRQNEPGWTDAEPEGRADRRPQPSQRDEPRRAAEALGKGRAARHRAAKRDTAARTSVSRKVSANEGVVQTVPIGYSF